MHFASRSPIFSALLVIGSMVSLTVGASIARSLFSVMGPGGTTFLRLGISCLILTALRKPWKVRLNASQWKWTALYGSILGLMNLFFYFAISRLPIGLAIGIEFLGPLAVALALSRNALDLLWALLALTGILQILPHAQAAALDMTGVIFALIAASLWALYILVGKRTGNRVPAANATSYGMAVGALVVSPLGFLPSLALRQHPDLTWAALGVGLLSSAIPYTLEFVALKNLSSKSYGILVSLEPAIGALMAFIILGEKLTSLQMMAVACVITASIGSTAAGRREARDTMTKPVAAP